MCEFIFNKNTCVLFHSFHFHILKILLVDIYFHSEKVIVLSMFFNLIVFTRQGKCIFNAECHNRKLKGAMTDQDLRLMFGLLHSLKSFCNQITPKQGAENNVQVYSYTTKGYKLHYYETLTGLRFVLTTDPFADNLQDLLKQIYYLYADVVVRDPEYTIGEQITSDTFFSVVMEKLRANPHFS